MTSPAITVGTSPSFDDCHSFFLTKKKKLIGNHQHGIYGMEYPEYNTSDERYSLISDWALAILTKFNVTEVCLEGYSYGSAAGLVFNLGENGGVLKHKLWINGIKYHVPAPTEIKKFYAVKGNAKKGEMYQVFLSETGVSLVDLLGVGEDKNPTSDIVDSFAILKFGFSNLFK